MFILGVGSACPDVVLSNEDLASLGLALSEEERTFLARSGVRSRRVSLPPEYLSQTKNADVVAGRSNATISPSALAVRAIHQALERAGITLEQVGLIVADTGTPDQTCPSEAQRIGGLLGVKVAAYDVVAGAGSIPHFLDMLSSWKPERVPDYVLCVSTNTLSQHVNYGADALSAHLVGDAAVAVVVSPRHHGKLTSRATFVRPQGQRSPSVVVEQYVTVHPSRVPSRQQLQAQLSEGLANLSEKSSFDISSAALIGPQIVAAEARILASSLGFTPQNVVDVCADGGYSAGASAGVALASLWDALTPGKAVVVLHAGDGQLSGSLLMASGKLEGTCCIS